MRQIGQRKPDHGLSAEQALFLALEDPQTACFLKTSFSTPEQKSEIITERRVTKNSLGYFWQVAIIEKPLPTLRANLPLLNIAHIIVDALDGKILRRWFLRNVFSEEYQEFKRRLFAPHEGCKGQNL
jgi:hypothetical protein